MTQTAEASQPDAEATVAVPRLFMPDTVTPADLAKLLALAAQLALAVMVIREFQIESRTFYHVALLAAGGFVVHALLPLALRLPFFVFLSMAAIAVTFGPLDGAWLIGTGLVLIGVCHLPLSYLARIAILIALGGGLAVVRGGLVASPWSQAIWPILGSMFMFRLALYLYALRHDRALPTGTWTLAYFFMIPNSVFPLYPVVDYSTFTRNYYDRDPFEIYQTGMQWIVRGLVHLLLYRLVYKFGPLDVAAVSDIGDLTQYVLAIFLLYLRVSGSFHLIVGVLHLFGFRLPETHHLYYLASSFTDFWRRINIYWKDFMMKLVYYPSFFRLRRFGDRSALVGATIVVFFSTWLLHSYQWFWLRGGFPLTLEDALFWSILGGLVVITSLREMRRGRKRTLTQANRDWDAARAVRTVATFCTICVLWSLWSAESVVGWLWMWHAAGSADGADLLLLGGLLVAGLAIAGRNWDAPAAGATDRLPFYRAPAVQGASLLGALLILAQPVVHEQAGPRLAGIMAELGQSTLNARDAGAHHRGYYERLDNPSRLSNQLWDVNAGKSADWQNFWDLRAQDLPRDRSDFLVYDLRPSRRVSFNGYPLTTNRWGMRDQEYVLAKPVSTFRIAVLGPSHVMGYNVADGDAFESRLEERLNDPASGGGALNFEVLNFAVSGYSILQQLAMLEDRAVGFQPDVVIFTHDGMADLWVRDHLTKAFAVGAPVPYPELQAILDSEGLGPVQLDRLPLPYAGVRRIAESFGVETRMPLVEADARIRRLHDDVFGWALQHGAALARQHGAVPVLLALNLPSEPRVLPAEELRPAQEAGMVVIDLFDVYRGHDLDSLRVAPWDSHPNARGHQLIADRLYEEIRSHAEALGVKVPLR